MIFKTDIYILIYIYIYYEVFIQKHKGKLARTASHQARCSISPAADVSSGLSVWMSRLSFHDPFCLYLSGDFT
jgi:hypothetical protein